MLVAAGIVLLIILKKPTEVVEPVAERAVAVTVRRIEPRSVDDIVVLAGRIEPNIEADLAAEKSGRVVRLEADKGDRVKRGNVLLGVDARSWEAALRSAEVENREATRDVGRWEELRKTGAVSERDFETAVARRDRAAAALEDAQVNLDKCEVRSPITGQVDARYVEEGEYVAEGMPVFKVIDMDPVKLVFQLPEKDVQALRAADTVRFTVGVWPDRFFTGRVSFVSSQADHAANGFRTEALVPNPESRLKAGMIAEVSVLRGALENAVVLPVSAVIPQRGEHVVYVVDGDRAVRRVVTIERLVGSEVIVSSGVGAGDRVVVEGQRSVVDGGLVRIVSE